MRSVVPNGAPFSIRGGRVRRGNSDVLRNIDFEFNAGEFVVLLGANGSGKTTLVKALLGLIPCAGGTIHLFGVPLERFRERERIGYVPQRSGAVSGVPASVMEVVLSGRAARAGLLRPYGSNDRAAATAALEAVDLRDLASSPVSSLSGGQQQRVLIGRALAGEPDVLVLDEPVASVDIAHQSSFAKILGELNNRGTSILLVAHTLGAMAPLLDRSVVLEGGRIVYDGPAREHSDMHEHHHHQHPIHEEEPEPRL